jgi:2'-5' RNA ligase
MRVFTGLSIPDDTLPQFDAILNQLRPSADVRWSPLSNLHITTAFIGAWEESRLAELRAALSQVAPPPGPVPIHVTGFGFFPNPHRPHTFFLNVKSEPALIAVASDIVNALSTVGYKPEDRPWHPHITLARIARENITQLRFQTAAMNTLFPLAGFAATAFHLYESRPSATGSVYSRLATFPFQGAAR